MANRSRCCQDSNLGVKLVSFESTLHRAYSGLAGAGSRSRFAPVQIDNNFTGTAFANSPVIVLAVSIPPPARQPGNGPYHAFIVVLFASHQICGPHVVDIARMDSRKVFIGDNIVDIGRYRSDNTYYSKNMENTE